MRLARNLRVSMRALGAHRGRTMLTIAATAIGIAGVVVLVALGSGTRERVLAQIDEMGRNVVVVTATRPDARRRVIRRSPALTRGLTLADAEAIRRSGTGVLRVAPVVDRDLLARYATVRTPANVAGTTPDWAAIRRFDVTAGRFINAQDRATLARVAVLGARTARVLFGDSVPPLGRTIVISGVSFEVIGVLGEKGMSASGTATEDDKVIIPFETAQRRLLGSNQANSIFVEIADTADSRVVADVLSARRLLDGRVGPEYRIDGQRVLADARLAAQRPFRQLIGALAVLSLVVAGVGVLATMVIAVRERRREIGLRIALGARQRDLFVQFLGETLVLTIAGGLLGSALGVAAADVMTRFTRWQLPIGASTLWAAVLGTTAIGVLAGLVPAMRAARMEPVAALSAS